MGNQVTTLGQIYPVEYYLIDYNNEFTLDANLGSTRFMKVARVKHREMGYCVAKVYAINDPSIPIHEHKLKLEQIRDAIQQSDTFNPLPFSHCLVNDKCVLILRQFIKYNLYDRLSTRPFLTSIEKRWIAYQMLRCTQSLHKQSIYHGDIKSENILVTSYLWVCLADFASYKPVTLPENNPSDFSYFFDTSRRHCCNMAPERFIEPTNTNNDVEATADAKPYYMSDVDVTQLTPQMDLFSLGCVFAELFSDDTPNSSIFDLGQILMYKKGQYDPTKFIEESIADSRIRGLILNLTDLDPGKRNSASYHLDQLIHSLFPAYFQTLYDYFAKLIPERPDSKILILNKDLNKLMEEIITEEEHGLLLPLVLATSTLRALNNTDAKLIGLSTCVRLIESSPVVMADYILDRLLPYIMQLLSESESRVRALCVTSLNTMLKHIDKLQMTDANVFIDYVLPNLMPLAYDPSALVRITMASHITELAATAKRLTESCDEDPSQKLNLLKDSFGAIVSQMLVDPNNHVRRAMLNQGMSDLCAFLGPEKTDEVVLSHIVTFLNDKSDFRLRVSFFDYVCQISDRLGPNYAPVVKPLMQKGLADSEEIVIYRCLCAISYMTKNNLLTKEVIYELFQEAIPLLSFPNKWIRNAVINFILVLSKADQPIDFNRRILPAIKLHLYRDIHGLRDEIVLLDSLQNPLPRVVIESILNGEHDIDEMFHMITKRKMARDKKRYRTISETDTQDYDDLMDQPKSDKELLVNIDRFSEDRLIDSELILRRIHKNKRTSASKQIEPNVSIKRQDTAIRSQVGLDFRSSPPATISLTRTTRPRGILLAHLHEHKAAINKLAVIPGTTHFVSCSNDATIKVWDSVGVAQRPQVLFRSKQTFVSPDAGAIKTAAVCMGAETLMALSDSNNLHLLQLYSPSSRSRGLKSINFSTELNQPQLITDLVALSPYTYATCSTSSQLRGYDLRLPTTSELWTLKMEGSDGLITCLDGNEFSLSCGTSSSVIAIFDLRFYIRATKMSYPPYQDKMRKRIRQIMISNDEIYCSVDGNNEVSAWDCESASRSKTLWASPAPCLSSTHSSHHSVLSMIVDSSTDTNSIITAGDDMRIRFWDLNNPHRSYLVSSPPLNSHHKLSHPPTSKRNLRKQANDGVDQINCTYYQMKLVDGIQVIQETGKLPENTIVATNNTGAGAKSTSATGQVSSNRQQGVVSYTDGSAISTTNNIGGAGNPSSSVSGGVTSSSSTSSGQTSASGAASSTDGLILSSAHHDSISCLAKINQSSLLLSASRDGVIKIWR